MSVFLAESTVLFLVAPPISLLLGDLTVFSVFIYLFFLLWRCDPTRVMASSFLRFPDHTRRRTTVGRTLLDE